MRRVIAYSLLGLAALLPGEARAGTLDGFLDLSLSADRTEFRAVAQAYYYYQGEEIDWNADLAGSLNVEQTNPAITYQMPISTQGSFAGNCKVRRNSAPVITPRCK